MVRHASDLRQPDPGRHARDEIEMSHVLRVLSPIWAVKTETASRVRGRIEKVLDYAAAHKYRQGLNPARWKGNLDAVLDKPGDVAKVKHHAALPIDVVPDFMVRLREAVGMGARALELTILTAARSGEIRGAKWEEFDLESGTWVVPAERMKAKKEHRVPLSRQALTLLKALPREGRRVSCFSRTAWGGRAERHDIDLSAAPHEC